MIQSPPFEAKLSSMHSFLIPTAIAGMFREQGHDRVKVLVRFEGKEISYHAALRPIKGNFPVMLNKPNQNYLGLFPNDYFEVRLCEDNTRYGVDLPEEFTAVMKSDPEAQEVFDTLSTGKQRGLIYMILRYKNSQTRIDKTLCLCENLKRGIHDPKELLRPL